MAKVLILVKTLYMDREFFNLSTISTLHKLNTQYIIAATANRKINRMLSDLKKKFGSASTILEYQFKKGGPKGLRENNLSNIALLL